MALELLLMPFILLQYILFSPCSLVRTKFPNRVIYRVPRAGKGGTFGHIAHERDFSFLPLHKYAILSMNRWH